MDNPSGHVRTGDLINNIFSLVTSTRCVSQMSKISWAKFIFWKHDITAYPSVAHSSFCGILVAHNLVFCGVCLFSLFHLIIYCLSFDLFSDCPVQIFCKIFIDSVEDHANVDAHDAFWHKTFVYKDKRAFNFI